MQSYLSSLLSGDFSEPSAPKLMQKPKKPLPLFFADGVPRNCARDSGRSSVAETKLVVAPLPWNDHTCLLPGTSSEHDDATVAG